MNIGTYFDYNTDMAYKHPYKNTRPHEKALLRGNRSEIADLAFLSAVANFHQCLSPIVSKLLTQNTNQYLGKPLDKHIWELAKTSNRFVTSKCVGVGNN